GFLLSASQQCYTPRERHETKSLKRHGHYIPMSIICPGLTALSLYKRLPFSPVILFLIFPEPHES
ncbi:hypothetical protein, partial [Cronobacter sakazakii]|uniref:hypothetical protein n=1 Tax=Cronobacter sakazakii TaxID=28141 RepID=UPI002115F6E9